MTPEDLIHIGNEAIARFMGAAYDKRHLERKNEILWKFTSGYPYMLRITKGIKWAKFHTIELKYHEDWNWLMDVVEAIRENKCVSMFNETSECDKKSGEYVCCIGNSSVGIQDIKTKGNSQMETVYNAVIKYIQWYNENKDI